MDARRAALGFADDAEMQAALQRRAMVEEAFELREAGVDPNTVSDALVLGLKGEEGFTLRDAALFALSVAPVTGNAMAAHASVEAGQTLLDAIDAEDWDTAQEAGIALGIEIFGLLPGIGGTLSKAAKAARAAGKAGEAGGSLLTRSIENVRGRYDPFSGVWKTVKTRFEDGVDQVVAQHDAGGMIEMGAETTGMTRGKMRNAGYSDLTPKTLFEGEDAQAAYQAWKKQQQEALDKLKNDPKPAGKENLEEPKSDSDAVAKESPKDPVASFEGKVRQALGEAAEQHFNARLTKAGVPTYEHPKKGRISAEHPNAKTARHPDTVVLGAVEVKNGRVTSKPFPKRNDKKRPVTLGEVKSGHATRSQSQVDFDKKISEDRPSQIKGDDNTVAVARFDARAPLHEMPWDTVEGIMGTILDDPKYAFDPKQREQLMASLKSHYDTSRASKKGLSFMDYVIANLNGLKRVFIPPSQKGVRGGLPAPPSK